MGKLQPEVGQLDMRDAAGNNGCVVEKFDERLCVESGDFLFHNLQLTLSSKALPFGMRPGPSIHEVRGRRCFPRFVTKDVV